MLRSEAQCLAAVRAIARGMPTGIAGGAGIPEVYGIEEYRKRRCRRRTAMRFELRAGNGEIGGEDPHALQRNLGCDEESAERVRPVS